MGKGGDLWDDFALINAFDDAISKYKKMHNSKDLDSFEAGETICRTQENVLASAVEILDSGRHPEACDNSNVISNTITEMGKKNTLSQTGKNCSGDEITIEPCNISSNIEHGQEVPHTYLTNICDHEEYNSLLKKYNELEDQKQKIAHQLHQLENWNYQFACSSSQWGTSTSQENLASATQESYSTVFCPYGCQCIVTPCPSITACSCGGTQVCKKFNAASAKNADEQQISFENGDFVKTAMRAAEGALSTLKTTASCTPVAIINQGKEKEIEANASSQQAHATSSETDLAVVLNAWYSAGFHTGKYLSQQSLTKK